MRALARGGRKNPMSIEDRVMRTERHFNETLATGREAIEGFKAGSERNLDTGGRISERGAKMTGCLR